MRSPNERPASLAEKEADRYDHADLAYVGVAVAPASATAATAGIQGETEDWLYVGVAMHAPWSSPNEVRVTVDIDVDDDRTPDFRLSNGDELGYNAESPASDAFVSVLQNLQTRVRTVQAPLNAVNATEADTRPFGEPGVGAAGAAARSRPGGCGARPSTITVTTYSQDLEDGDAPVDTSPQLTYDLGSPMIDLRECRPACAALRRRAWAGSCA